MRHWRNLAGVLLKDWWRYERALRCDDSAYLGTRNRRERLVPASSGEGYHCAWQWTSDLHAPKYRPSLGLRRMQRALGEHPTSRCTSNMGSLDGPELC